MVIDEVFTNLKAVSGAILSRSKKSTKVRLDSWKLEQKWPFPWLKLVNMVNCILIVRGKRVFP